MAATLALLVVPVADHAFARQRNLAFHGQLDYAAFRVAAARGDTVTIKSSPGGSGAAAMALARVSNVVVDGRCNSACAWSFVRNKNACFTSRASFGFHAAHDPGTGRRLNAATGFWLAQVRGSLRSKLEPLLRSSNLIRISAAEMRRHYGDRVCGGGERMMVAKLDLPPTKPQKRSAVPSERMMAADAVPSLAAASKPILAASGDFRSEMSPAWAAVDPGTAAAVAMTAIGNLESGSLVGLPEQALLASHLRTTSWLDVAFAQAAATVFPQDDQHIASLAGEREAWRALAMAWTDTDSRHDTLAALEILEALRIREPCNREDELDQCASAMELVVGDGVHPLMQPNDAVALDVGPASTGVIEPRLSILLLGSAGVMFA